VYRSCLNANGVTVQLFQRKTLVLAFVVPQLGQPAAETPPSWLIRRIQDGELSINRLGGLDTRTPWGVQSCAPGDIVLLTDQDTIQFANPSEFASFEPVSGDELRKAA
jgi:hypothetical protein